jgi:hypothetical protein
MNTIMCNGIVFLLSITFAYGKPQVPDNAAIIGKLK